MDEIITISSDSIEFSEDELGMGLSDFLLNENHKTVL